MRILGNIPHPEFKIVAYTLEKHFYVEIEAGPMKQCFKLHKETTGNLEGIKKLMNEEFLTRTHQLFEEMYLNYKKALHNTEQGH